MHVRELNDLPTPSTCGDKTAVLHAGSHAMVIYEVSDLAVSQGHPQGCALVDFTGCRRVLTGGPNDEALGNHPAAKWGVRWYSFQEVVDSPMIAEQERMFHKDRQTNQRSSLRHFVLAMKEDTVDVFAEDCRLVGVFPDRRAAMTAAVAALINLEDAV